MERQSLETNQCLLPLICSFFLLLWFIHQSFSTSHLHFVSLFSPLSSPAIFASTLSPSPLHPCVSKDPSTVQHPSPTLLPFALVFAFIYLDRFHLKRNNPLTGSFIQMTSSNPFPAVGWINPAHSLPLTEFITESRIQSVWRQRRGADYYWSFREGEEQIAKKDTRNQGKRKEKKTAVTSGHGQCTELNKNNRSLDMHLHKAIHKAIQVILHTIYFWRECREHWGGKFVFVCTWMRICRV